MCGISGALFIDKREYPAMRHCVNSIVIDQNDRGPDANSVEVIEERDCGIIFGHNRLKIVDLSAEANQPMWDHTKKVCIVFNGEIYNYIELKQELKNLGASFFTNSDTEVMLEAYKRWGIQAVNKFNGMFAFALYDVEKRSLFIVRDRFGVKPLFYYCSSKHLLFASSSNIIAKHESLNTNFKYLSRGIQYSLYESDDISPYESLSQLLPGSYLEINTAAGSIDYKVIAYYDLRNAVEQKQNSIQSYSANDFYGEFDDLLTSAVDLRFRADVPVGISLSAGLDSSSITSYALKKDRGNLVGFSFGDPENSESEGPLAKKIATKLGLTVHYINPSINEIWNAFLQTVLAHDAPVAGGSIIAGYLVYQKAKSEEFRVLLGGQGADEILAGYDKYRLFYLKNLLHKREYSTATKYFGSIIPILVLKSKDIGFYWKWRKRWLNQNGIDSILNFRLDEMFLDSNKDEPIWMRQVQDIYHASLPTLLRCDDRNSMGNSVECRAPFLDYRIVEYSLALPESYKLQQGYTKWVLRHCTEGKLPDEVRLNKYKWGFNVPYNRWIREGLGKKIRFVLKHNYSLINTYIKNNISIEENFSDEEMIKRPTSCAEVSSLLWIISKTENLNGFRT